MVSPWPDLLQLANVAASLRRVMFPRDYEWDTLWKGARLEQISPGQADARQTSFWLFFHCRWSSEAWLPFCPSWQSESVDGVNAIAHKAIKPAQTVNLLTAQLGPWRDQKPKGSNLHFLLWWTVKDLKLSVEWGTQWCFYSAGFKNDFPVVAVGGNWRVLLLHPSHRAQKLACVSFSAKVDPGFILKKDLLISNRCRKSCVKLTRAVSTSCSNAKVTFPESTDHCRLLMHLTKSTIPTRITSAS